MAYLMLNGCSSSTTSLLIHSNRRLNGAAFFPRRCCLRTTVSGRGFTLSIRSSCDDALMVIDEKVVADKVILETRTEVSRMKKSIDVVPGLAVLQVGEKNHPLSDLELCSSVGIKPFVVHLDEDSSEEELLKSISGFNNDPSVHGILVQLPKPSHMDKQEILNAISIEKDIEGINPINIGLLAMRKREPFFAPCAPKGCIELLHHYNFKIGGKRAVVIGRSNSFGLPTALLLLREDASVSLIHSRTKNPEEITRKAEIIISAVGKPNIVRGNWIKPGAVIIDVGSSFVKDPNASDGSGCGGDVCYEEVCKIASAITPVGGGGVKQIASVMALSNTLTSAKRFHNFH